MPDQNDYPLYDENNEDRSDEEFNQLKGAIQKIHNILRGEQPGEITNSDIAQYLRVVNYNFNALAAMLNKTLLLIGEISLRQATLRDSVTNIEIELKEFTDVNSFLDATLNKNESNSKKK